MKFEVRTDARNQNAQYISFADTKLGTGIIRDFTKYVADAYNYVSSFESPFSNKIMNPARWRNFKYNKKVYLNGSNDFRELIGKYKGQTLFICGNGYSLKDNVDLLKGVDGKVMALNGAIDLLPKVDFFMALEWTSHLKLKQMTYDVPAILAISCNPNIIKKFPNKYFIQDNRHSELENKIREKVPGMFGIDVNLEVGFSALHVAWLLGFTKIVTIGFEHCYSAPEKIHATEDFKDTKEMLKLELDDGTTVFSNGAMMVGAATIKAAFYFLRKQGVRIIECSNGLIDEECEMMPLIEAIGEADLGIKTSQSK